MNNKESMRIRARINKWWSRKKIEVDVDNRLSSIWSSGIMICIDFVFCNARSIDDKHFYILLLWRRKKGQKYDVSFFFLSCKEKRASIIDKNGNMWHTHTRSLYNEWQREKIIKDWLMAHEDFDNLFQTL
jgi:hypothetical protein